jgi:hypothetical protein
MRIIRRDIALQPVRLQAVLGPDPGNRHVRNFSAQFGCQLARGPVRRTVRRLALGGPCQYPRFQAVTDFVALTPGIACEQSSQPLGFKSLAPAADVAVEGR